MLENNDVVNDLENELNVENIEAVAYCRAKKNKDLMTVIALENQKNAIREYADKNNIKIVEWYIDDGYSGVNDKRPAFQRMFDDLNNKKYNECKNVKILLIHKIDRFARDLRTFNHYEKYLDLYKVELKVINCDIPNTVERKMMMQMMISLQEIYSKNISNSIKKSMTFLAKDSSYLSGTILYGYDISENKKYVINENEAQIVRLIFDMYIYYGSLKEVAQELKKRNIKTRNENDFSVNYLSKLLSNEKYIGTFTYNELSNYKENGKTKRKRNIETDIIRIENTIPPIIDKKTFALAQKRKNERVQS